MIISLSGLIGSGKDTVADYLVTEYGFRRESFAGTLKDACASIFGWDREMLEGKTEAARTLRDMVDPWWSKRLNMPNFTPRWVLQNFGTDCCRTHFHNDIWLASLENKLRNMTKQDVVISDSRFINELKMLSDLGATTVRVVRGENPNWWDTARKAAFLASAAKTMGTMGIHRSEWDWAGYDFNVIMLNNGTLGELYAKTKLIVFTGQE